LFEGFQEGGQVAPLQVANVNSTLLGARNSVLKDIQDTTNSLDQFKLQLGVPANLPLILDDTPARAITRQLDRYYQILDDADAAAYKLVERKAQVAPAKLRATLRDLYTRVPLVRGTEFQKRITPSLDAWAGLTDEQMKARLDKLGAERRRLLDAKTDQEMKGQKLSVAEARQLRDADFETDVGGLEQILRRYLARPWEKAAKEEQRQLERAKLFRNVAYAAALVLVWARNERFDQVGTQWPELLTVPLGDLDLLTANVEKAEQAAVWEALQSRVDLMNARAQLV